MSTTGPISADHLLDSLIDALAERVADKMAARMGATNPRYATARNNPIGSPRAFLDAARRGDFPTFRRGRCVAALWADVERFVENSRLSPKDTRDEERTMLLRRGLVLKRR